MPNLFQNTEPCLVVLDKIATRNIENERLRECFDRLHAAIVVPGSGYPNDEGERTKAAVLMVLKDALLGRSHG